MVIHWFATGRMMAVSGRFTALVNRVRYREEVAQDDPLTEDDLVAAIRAMTAETFGESALDPASSDEEGEGVQLGLAEATHPTIPAPAAPLAPQPTWMHWVFFVSLALGGLVSAVLAGTFDVSWPLHGAGFRATFGDGAGSMAALLFGGLLTGFGTRMAGGCTSGHGLCGVSRVQPGSLLATAGFFGAGILLSLALEAL